VKRRSNTIWKIRMRHHAIAVPREERGRGLLDRVLRPRGAVAVEEVDHVVRAEHDGDERARRGCDASLRIARRGSIVGG